MSIRYQYQGHEKCDFNGVVQNGVKRDTWTKFLTMSHLLAISKKEYLLSIPFPNLGLRKTNNV